MSKNLIICIDYNSKFLQQLEDRISSLLNNNFEIHTFSNGEVALKSCQENVRKGYEIILTISNLRLPKMNGDEFIRGINKISKTSNNILFIDDIPLNNIAKILNEKIADKVLTRKNLVKEVILITKNILSSFKISSELLKKNKYLKNKINKSQKLLDIKDTQLDVISKTDTLTNMYNRKGFFLQANKLLLDSKSKETSFSIILFEIDNFKEINKKFGRNNGNKYIQDFAYILFQLLNFNELLARVDSKVFALALPSINKNHCQDILANILFTLNKKTICINENNLEISVRTSTSSIEKSTDSMGFIFDKAMNELN